MNNSLGIDIGGTNTAFSILDGDNQVIFSDSVSTLDYPDAQALLNQVKLACEAQKVKYDVVGIGAPSLNQHTGNIEYAPNLKAWGNIIPLKELAMDCFGVPVSVVNDANAAAIAEKYVGEAQDLDNFAVITLGTGIGSGIFMNGKLLLGDSGVAGELGQLVIRRDGRESNNGLFGTLEMYVGSPGIIQTAKEKLEFSSVGSLLHATAPSEISPIEIFKYARKEDPVALEVADLVCEDLAFGLSHLVNLLNINTIFLTGGIAKSGNILRRKTEKNLKFYLHPGIRELVDLKISGLIEENAGVIGAAIIAKKHEEIIPA